MCYATRVVREAEEFEAFYNVERLLGIYGPEMELTYNHANGFAHPNMWIIPQEHPRNMMPVMWGLIPHYKLGQNAKEYYKETIRYGSGLNAKSEKLFNSNNYKGSALTRRCIVPVDGFFEPHTTPAKVNGRAFKVPFYFHRKNEDPMHLAGIYTLTKDNYYTFTILTKAASPLFAKIHNQKFRRPVILQDDDIDVWLDNNLNEEEVMQVIEDDLADAEINAYPISRDLYSPKVDSDREDIIEKIEYSEVEIEY